MATMRINYARRGFKTVDEYVDIYGGKTDDEDFSEETLTEAKVWCRNCQRLDKKLITEVNDRDLKNNPIVCTQCMNKNIDIAYLTTDVIPRIYIDENHANCHMEIFDKIRDLYDVGTLPQFYRQKAELLFNSDYYGVGSNAAVGFKNTDDPLPGNIIDAQTGQLRTWKDYPWNEVIVLSTENLLDPYRRVPTFPEIKGIPHRDDFYNSVGSIKTDPETGEQITEYTITDIINMHGIQAYLREGEGTEISPYTYTGLGTSFTFPATYGGNYISPAPVEETTVHLQKVVVLRGSQFWSWNGDPNSDYPLTQAQITAIINEYDDQYPRNELEIPNGDVVLGIFEADYYVGPGVRNASFNYNVPEGILIQESIVIPKMSLTEIENYLPTYPAIETPVYDATDYCDCINEDPSVVLPGAPGYNTEEYNLLSGGFSFPPIPFKVNSKTFERMSEAQQKAVTDYPELITQDLITTVDSRVGTIFPGIDIPAFVPKQINRLIPMKNCSPCVISNNHIYSSMLNIIIQVDLDAPIYDNSLFD